MTRQRLKITPAGLLPIGSAIALDAQRYELIAHGWFESEHTSCPAMVWRSVCAEPGCEQSFTTKSLECHWPGTRRCERHRKAGKRVAAPEPRP